MFELTNAQRACFGLKPVEGSRKRITPKPSPYDQHTTVACLDGTVLRKYIETGDKLYRAYELCEQLSDDLRFLLPKTTKGKQALLSAAPQCRPARPPGADAPGSEKSGAFHAVYRFKGHAYGIYEE